MIGFDEETSGRLERLRQRFFPPERNVVPAHLCLFHALPSEQDRLLVELFDGEAQRFPTIPLVFSSILPMGAGFGLSVDAPRLLTLHRRLATACSPWLTPQDRQPFRLHVTLMNKAKRNDARQALAEFQAEFEPWGGMGDSIEVWAYLGGPWKPLARYPLSGDPRLPLRRTHPPCPATRTLTTT